MALTQIILSVDTDTNTLTLNDAVTVPSGQPSGVEEITANYSASTTDDTIINTSTAAAVITVTLPNANLVAGKEYHIVNANATTGGTLTISPAVNVANGSTVSSLAISSRITVKSDGTNYWQVS